MINEIKRLLLKLQSRIDKLTEKLKKPIVNNHDYWDGFNDALIELQAELEKILKP